LVCCANTANGLAKAIAAIAKPSPAFRALLLTIFASSLERKTPISFFIWGSLIFFTKLNLF
jgi:hypothetical protein